MKKVGLVFCLSFLVLFVFVTPVMSSDDWVEYNRTEDGSVFLYNKKNITKSRGKNIVRVWIRKIYSEEDGEKIIREMRNSGRSTEGMGIRSFGITLYQIDCNNKKYKCLHITEYDKDGKVLDSFDVDDPKWEYSIPGTRVDRLREIVCK